MYGRNRKQLIPSQTQIVHYIHRWRHEVTDREDSGLVVKDYACLILRIPTKIL